MAATDSPVWQCQVCGRCDHATDHESVFQAMSAVTCSWAGDSACIGSLIWAWLTQLYARSPCCGVSSPSCSTSCETRRPNALSTSLYAASATVADHASVKSTAIAW